jgi:hypothetical protein
MNDRRVPTFGQSLKLLNSSELDDLVWKTVKKERGQTLKSPVET